MANLHISIAAEPMFHLGPVSITNSILTSWLVSAGLILFALWFGKKLQTIRYTDKPGKFQSFVEFVIANLYDLVHSITASTKKARVFFPLIATFFFFIMFSNWSGLLPGVGSIGFREPAEISIENAEGASHSENQASAPENEGPVESTGVFVPYFRAPTADLNTTLALALISVTAIQVMGVRFLHLSYFRKFLNLTSPINFAVGILEILSEVSRIISFAFRLFGNIFAGEVLLAVIAALIPVALPIPFYGLEIFVGLIQALVFALLSLVFYNMATLGHGEESH